MTERYIDQINTLRHALDQAAQGNLGNPDVTNVVMKQDPGLSIKDRLQALNIASCQFVQNTVETMHGEIMLALQFAETTRKYDDLLQNSSEFWDVERADDATLCHYYFRRSADEMAYLAETGYNPQVTGQLIRQNGTLYLEYLQLFDQNAPPLTKADGKESFDPQALQCTVFNLRKSGFDKAIHQVETLRDRAIICLTRMDLLLGEAAPFLQTSGKDITPLKEDAKNAFCVGKQALDDAETVLTRHALRHSAFADRFYGVKGPGGTPVIT